MSLQNPFEVDGLASESSLAFFASAAELEYGWAQNECVQSTKDTHRMVFRNLDPSLCGFKYDLQDGQCVAVTPDKVFLWKTTIENCKMGVALEYGWIQNECVRSTKETHHIVERNLDPTLCGYKYEMGDGKCSAVTPTKVRLWTTLPERCAN